jgi:transcription antitermination factor NusG
MKEDSWVILEISSKGEKEARDGTLVSRITECSSFKKEDIFVPLIRGGAKPLWLMEGYIFIKSGYGASEYYDLKRTYLISRVLSQVDAKTGLISKGVVKSSELEEMIKKADDLGGKFELGSEVSLIDGAFKGFEGVLVDSWKENNLRYYSVLIKMRSVEILTKVSCLSIEG